MDRGPSPGCCPGLPGPGQQLAAHPVELTDVAPSGSCAGRWPGWMAPLTVPPRVQASPPGAQHIGVLSMQSPPARAEATSVIGSCRPRSPAPGHRPGRGAAGRVRAGRDAGPGWPEGASPALATRRRSSKVIWIRSGWLRDSSYWVLGTFLGSVFVAKPLSQEALEDLLAASGR